MYYVTLHHVTLYHVTLYHVTLYHVTLYHVTLYHVTLYHVTLQVLLLSFCRGGIKLTNANRVWAGWETSVLHKLSGGLPRVAKSLLCEEIRREEWRRNPFPFVDVPVDYYVCYSTLPDSMWA